MSRVNRRSSPFPRWRNSSGSSGPRTAQASQLLVHQNSFRLTAPLADNHNQRRSPVPPHRCGFPTERARQRSSFQTASSLPLRNSWLERRQLSLSSKNPKSFEEGSVSKTYYKNLSETTTRHALTHTKFQAVQKNSRTKPFFAGVKRSPDIKDFLDYPPAKQQVNMEERYDVPYQSRSSQLGNSNVQWCAPPCRQRSDSRERKFDLAQRGSYSAKQCHDRNSRGQHPISWRQFPSAKLSNDLERSSHCSGVQRSSPRLQGKSGECARHHLEQRNRSGSVNMKTVQHSELGDRSSNLNYKQRCRNAMSSNLRHHERHHQRQSSPTVNSRCLQDAIRSRETSFSSERDSCHQTKTRKSQRRHGIFERESEEDVHQESNNLANSRRSSSIESFSQADRSRPDILPQENSRSQSLSSISSRSHSADKGTSNQSDRSVERDRSVNSPSTSSGVKVKLLKFNPDYVVIIRRTNEGAKPLCTREEFSGKLAPLVNNDEQLPVAAQKCYSSDRSTSSLMAPVDLRQKDDRPGSGFSPAGEGSLKKSTRELCELAEKADDVMNAKPITANFPIESRTGTNAGPMPTKTDVADERFVRTRPNSFEEQRCKKQTDHTSKSIDKESYLTSKKSSFDLRQKIAERRRMGTGRNTSTGIVMSQIHRWRSLPQTSFRNLVFGYRATKRKHSFGPWKTDSLRSVVLK